MEVYLFPASEGNCILYLPRCLWERKVYFFLPDLGKCCSSIEIYRVVRISNDTRSKIKLEIGHWHIGVILDYPLSYPIITEYTNQNINLQSTAIINNSYLYTYLQVFNSCLILDILRFMFYTVATLQNKWCTVI